MFVKTLRVPNSGSLMPRQQKWVGSSWTQDLPFFMSGTVPEA